MDQPQVTATTWQHPTGRVPESVLVVALGPSKHDLLELTTGHEPDPRIMSCEEVWSMNGGANHMAGRVRYDLLWVMDYLDGETDKEPRYMQNVLAYLHRHKTPLMTSQVGRYAGHEQMHELPIKQMVDYFGAENAYWHNSIPYIIAYALFIGVKRLVLFGADYAHEKLKNREEDRSNAEYWVGFARARGMQIDLPSSTTLLNTHRGPWFYGYRDQPVHLVREG